MTVALNASEGVLVAHYVLFATRFMAGRGHAEAQVLAGTGLTIDELEQYPHYLVSLPALLGVIRNIHALDLSPTLSFELGSQLTLGSHGFLGYALQASQTLAEALALAHRYSLTRTQLLQLSVSLSGEKAVFEVNDNGLLGPWFPRIIETLLACIFSIGRELLGEPPLNEVELALSLPAEAHHAWLLALTGQQLRFDCPTTRICFPAAWLALPLPRHDPQLAALAAARCHAELQAAERNADLLTRVRKLTQLHLADPQAQERVAEALNITARTLHRRLQVQGLNFKVMLDDQRRNLATAKLRHESDSIGEVAAALGYHDQANFVRAFKRWTGTTPSQFRKG